MNELNPTNAFGELLLDLIEAQYGGDYDAGIQALVESTGLTEDEVVAIVQGEFIVEDQALLSDIIEAFPEADDDDLEVIVNVASDVDEADRDELISEIEATEGEMAGEEEMDMEEEPELAGAYANRASTANFSAPVVNRLNQVENQLANFQYEAALKQELKNIDVEASNYVSDAMLPPSCKALLIGNFANDDSARMARFSQMASENGVDVDTMLFATKYALGMLKSTSKFVEFKDYSISSEDVALANFSAGLDSLIEEDISNMDFLK